MKLSKPIKQIIKKPFISKENKKNIRGGIIKDIQIHFETEEENKKKQNIMKH